jgi:hypothetical protein
MFVRYRGSIVGKPLLRNGRLKNVIMWEVPIEARSFSPDRILASHGGIFYGIR